MMLNLLKFIPTLLFASLVAGQLTITKPSSSLWWVADSPNELVWTFKTSPKETFTVLITNTDIKILSAPLAVIAIQHSYDGSIVVGREQVTQPAATGYTIIFANPLNNTEVYAVSEQFEIKAKNSAYPTGTASSMSSGPSSSANATSGVAHSGSVSPKAGLGAVGLAALGVAALFV